MRWPTSRRMARSTRAPAVGPHGRAGRLLARRGVFGQRADEPAEGGPPATFVRATTSAWRRCRTSSASSRSPKRYRRTRSSNEASRSPPTVWRHDRRKGGGLYAVNPIEQILNPVHPGSVARSSSTGGRWSCPIHPATDMTKALRTGGIMTDLYTARKHRPGDAPDTTLSGRFGQPSGNTGHASDLVTRHLGACDGAACHPRSPRTRPPASEPHPGRSRLAREAASTRVGFHTTRVTSSRRRPSLRRTARRSPRSRRADDSGTILAGDVAGERGTCAADRAVVEQQQDRRLS